jgi:hypothetical protein
MRLPPQGASELQRPGRKRELCQHDRQNRIQNQEKMKHVRRKISSAVERAGLKGLRTGEQPRTRSSPDLPETCRQRPCGAAKAPLAITAEGASRPLRTASGRPARSARAACTVPAPPAWDLRPHEQFPPRNGRGSKLSDAVGRRTLTWRPWRTAARPKPTADGRRELSEAKAAPCRARPSPPPPIRTREPKTIRCARSSPRFTASRRSRCRKLPQARPAETPRPSRQGESPSPPQPAIPEG